MATIQSLWQAWHSVDHRLPTQDDWAAKKALEPMQWGAKMHRGNTPGHEPSAVIGWPTWWFRASFTLHTPGFMMVFGRSLEVVHGCWCRLHIGITCWEASYWPYPLEASGSQDSCSTLSNEKTIVAQCCFWHFSLYWQVCLTFLCNYWIIVPPFSWH